MKLKKLLDKTSKASHVVLFDDNDEMFAYVEQDNGADSGYSLLCVKSGAHSAKENFDRTPDAIDAYKVEFIAPLMFETLGVQVSW